MLIGSLILMFPISFLFRSIILPSFLTFNAHKAQAENINLNSISIEQNQIFFIQNNQEQKYIFLASNEQNSCESTPRPLNPDANTQKLETDLDRYFRIAYNAETEGDFDTAIINYHRAFESATCNCDRSHAQAGKQAAKEAKELLKKEGISSKPTQFFWGRLQELTQSLSCVTTQ